MAKRTTSNKIYLLVIFILVLGLGFFAGLGYNNDFNVNLPHEEATSEETKQTEGTKEKEEELYEPEISHEEKIIETVEKSIEGVVAIEMEEQKISGSGFFVSEDGYILTNRHVVASEGDYYIITNDGEELPAEVISRDMVRDLAFLKVEGDNFTTLPLGNSDNLRLGQTAIAIGYSLGELKNSVSVGVISGLVRDIWAREGWDLEKLEGVIQTDAAINPGNSGGPLLNLRGEVIGINTAKNFGADNVGFAIPINQAKKAIESVLEHGKIVQPFLGIRYVMINEYEKEMRGLHVDHGALIVRGGPNQPAVEAGTPAHQAGLREGDILLSIEGRQINSENPLHELILEFSPGDKVEIEYMRGDWTDIMTVELAEREVD